MGSQAGHYWVPEKVLPGIAGPSHKMASNMSQIPLSGEVESVVLHAAHEILGISYRFSSLSIQDPSSYNLNIAKE